MRNKIGNFKVWNGRGQGRYINWRFNVAARSQKEAADLIHKAGGGFGSGSINEIREYYSPCWGNDMIGVIPTSPGVWAKKGYGKDKPKRIL